MPTILLLAFAALALSYPLADTDIWWHLAAGREIWRTGNALFVDPFCRSSMGTEWIDLHWGFQIAAWKLWTIFGTWSLVAMRIVLPVVAFAVAFGRKASSLSVLAGAVCLWISRSFLDARPILFTLLLLAIVQRALEADVSCHKRRTVLLAVVAQICLVNVQGLFLLGPLLVAVFAASAWMERRRRDGVRLSGLAIAVVVASLANPWGWRAFALAGKVAGRIAPSAGNLFSSEISENAPLWKWALDDPSKIFLVIWLVVATVMFWRRGASGRARLVLLIGAGLLSVAAVRNLPFLCLEVAFCLDFSARPNLVKIWTWSTASIVAALVAISVQERKWNLPFDPVAPLRLPSEEAFAIIERDPAPVFHELRAGGWFSWKAPSKGFCWADTRLVLHDAEFVRQYLAVVDHPEGFPSFVRRWRFGYSLVPIAEFPRFRALAVWLLRSNEWELVQCDGAWALFRLRNPSDTGDSPMLSRNPSESLHRRFGSNPLLDSTMRQNLNDYLVLAGPTRSEGVAP